MVENELGLDFDFVERGSSIKNKMRMIETAIAVSCVSWDLPLLFWQLRLL